MVEKNPIVAFKEAEILNGENAVIKNLNMEVGVGDFLYIIGKVGTGKTSIVRTIIAENRLEKGYGCVCGYDLRKIREKEIPYLRRELGVVFQDFQLLMDRSVRENLLFVLQATGWKDKAAIARRISEVLKAVGMEAMAEKVPSQLSGGEQQRVAIARALLNEPKVILADEPTGNLDPETADGIMELLRKINSENGTAVVMITHNINLCHKYKGRMMICRDNGCEEVLDDEVIDIDEILGENGAEFGF
ncbi:MAG: ATP-binding cassette domain-containing protein [Bacteroidales bacterium]|nr:ATP-binding cassette domain-containing protein [Bacteroidales bacterium]